MAGHGTTHKVNNLILQGTFANQDNSLTFSPKRKRSHRSFVPDSNLVELNYHHGKRFGPPALSFPENEASELMLDESNKRNFLWTLMRYKTTGRCIPSWTGFHILISNNILILKTAVGYPIYTVLTLLLLRYQQFTRYYVAFLVFLLNT